MESTDAGMRIGELARRTGVSVATLRAWERRHGLLDPARTPGGHRLYRDEDADRVLAVQKLIDEGWAVSAAARHVLSDRRPDDQRTSTELESALWEAIDAYDEAELERGLDEVVRGLPQSLDSVLVPLLRRLGEGWESDAGCIAREHFGAQAVRGRLLAVLPEAYGSDAVAWCVPGELHDTGLLMASVALTLGGWSVRFLGADTPAQAAAEAIRDVQPEVVLIAASDREVAARALDEIPNGDGHLTVLGGPGFRPADAAQVGKALHYDWSFQGLVGAVERTLPERTGG